MWDEERRNKSHDFNGLPMPEIEKMGNGGIFGSSESDKDNGEIRLT